MDPSSTSPVCGDASNPIPLAVSSAHIASSTLISPEEDQTDDCGLQPSRASLREEKRREASHYVTVREMRGWRKIVRNFTPSWFSVNMGTGIVSILLHNLPYNGVWLYWISVAMFVLNVSLFCLFLLLSIIRYTMYPKIWVAMIHHPVQSLFLGTFPMGLATIINMVTFVCVPAWGSPAIQLAWALWWIDIVLAVSICFYLPFVIMSFHKVELSTITAALLLPIVSTIVAAASGGIVAEVLPSPQDALITVTVSYILWGTGVPLAVAVLVMYFYRLTVHKLPPREVIVSVFLPLGPLGQGGFGIMQLGKVARTLFPLTGTLSAATTNAGDIFYVVGFLVALIMWGFGLVWFFFAIASISQSKFPFNMGWWGFTFPIGVFTVATTTFGKEMPSVFFDILGTVLSVAVTLLWIMVAAGTLKKASTGELFFAPCLKDLEGKEDKAAKHFGEKAV